MTTPAILMPYKKNGEIRDLYNTLGKLEGEIRTRCMYPTGVFVFSSFYC